MAGATRDMIQSHLLQVLALLAMEPPVSLEAESLRDEKVMLKSIRPIALSDGYELSSAVRAHMPVAGGGRGGGKPHRNLRRAQALRR